MTNARTLKKEIDIAHQVIEAALEEAFPETDPDLPVDDPFPAHHHPTYAKVTAMISAWKKLRIHCRSSTPDSDTDVLHDKHNVLHRVRAAAAYLPIMAKEADIVTFKDGGGQVLSDYLDKWQRFASLPEREELEIIIGAYAEVLGIEKQYLAARAKVVRSGIRDII